MNMASRHIEARRKIMHLFIGIFMVVLLINGIIDKNHIFFLIVIGIILSFLSKKYKIPVINWFLKNFERDRYLSKFPGKGVIFYFIGAFIVLSFFPDNIAMASILILALAEPASYVFGMNFGKIPHPLTNKKFLEGFVAGIIAGFLAANIFLPWHEALAASFFAMIAEGIEIKVGAEEVDDNIVMPLVAAVVIWAMRALV